MPMIERALTAAGVLVETLTTDDDGHGRQPRSQSPFFENGVTRHYLPRTSRTYQFAIGLGSWMRCHAAGFDLCHVHSVFNHVPMAATRCCARIGLPYIVRPCGILSAYGMGRRPWTKKLSLRLVEAPALRGAAAIHVTSAAELADVEALFSGPLRFAEIPLGIEPGPPGDASRWLKRFPMLMGAGLRLLFLSRIDPKKNLEALIDALVQLPADVVLCICGNGDDAYRAALEQRANEQGVAQRISWAGHVSGTDKADALAASDVFVLPSFAENFGISAVEAMLAGLPIIAAHGVALSGSIAEAGAGIAVEPDPQGVATAIRELTDYERRRDAARAARQLAQARYSPAAMGAKLVNLYRQICGR